MDKNQLTLVGRIGGRIVERKAQNGSSYMFFPIELENKAAADSTENNYHACVHVMLFKPKVIEYMKKVQAKTGNRVVVFGFVSAFKAEHKGEEIMSNGVNATEVYIIKTKPDN